MRIKGWAVTLGLVFLLLVGCGSDREAAGGSGREKSEAPPERLSKVRHLTVTLAGWEGPEDAGVVMAEELGYFDEVGLEVSILVPASPINALLYVVNRTDDLGVAHQPQVVQAKARGAQIVAFESVISQPTAAMIWLGRSKIEGIGDLKGKTIAVPGLPFQQGLLRSVLARAGLSLGDVTVEPVGYELVSSLVSGRADAIVGGSGNVEGVELESRGLDPVITPVSSLGVPAYEELVWITRTDFAAKNPQVIDAFRSALRRGTAAAIEDPRATAEAIDKAVESNPELGLKETEAGVEATLPLLSRTGRMSPRKASHLVDWMRSQGLIQHEVPASALLINDNTP